MIGTGNEHARVMGVKFDPPPDTTPPLPPTRTPARAARPAQTKALDTNPIKVKVAGRSFSAEGKSSASSTGKGAEPKTRRFSCASAKACVHSVTSDPTIPAAITGAVVLLLVLNCVFCKCCKRTSVGDGDGGQFAKKKKQFSISYELERNSRGELLPYAGSSSIDVPSSFSSPAGESGAFFEKAEDSAATSAAYRA